jgi:putative membrane protein
MRAIAQVLVALVALLHAYFLVLEMFLWTKPAGRRAFGTTQEQASSRRYSR